MDSSGTITHHRAHARRWAAAALLVGLSSCGPSTELVSWTDPEFQGPAFRSVMVTVMTDNLTARTAIEGALAQDLEELGVAAVRSLSLMSPDAVPDYDSLEARLSAIGVDGILVVEPLRSEDIERYTEGITYYQTYSTYLDARTNRIAQQREPNRVEVIGTIYRSRSSLYANNSDRLVWRGETGTPYYGDVGSSARNFASTIVGGLESDGMLRPTPPPRSR